MPPAETGGRPLRARVEEASVPVLARLAAAPKALTALLVGAVVVAALFTDHVLSGIALTAAALLMGWLTYLAWPRLPVAARALRLAVLLLVLVVAAARFG